MILVTRLNGAVFALNPDLVERADCTPDTVITLVDGTKYIVAESAARAHRPRSAHYRASRDPRPAAESTRHAERRRAMAAERRRGARRRRRTNVVQLHRRER